MNENWCATFLDSSQESLSSHEIFLLLVEYDVSSMLTVVLLVILSVSSTQYMFLSYLVSTYIKAGYHDSANIMGVGV